MVTLCFIRRLSILVPFLPMTNLALSLSVSILCTLSSAGLTRSSVAVLVALAILCPAVSVRWKPSFCTVLSFGVFLMSCVWMTRGVSVWAVSSLVFRTATSMSWAGDDCGGT